MAVLGSDRATDEIRALAKLSSLSYRTPASSLIEVAFGMALLPSMRCQTTTLE
jgi:hypothetical protein